MLRSIGKLSREFVIQKYGTKVRRYGWHSAVSRGWPFPVLKYKYIFQAILSNSSRKLLWFEIAKMLIAVLENETYRVVHCRVARCASRDVRRSQRKTAQRSWSCIPTAWCRGRNITSASSSCTATYGVCLDEFIY